MALVILTLVLIASGTMLWMPSTDIIQDSELCPGRSQATCRNLSPAAFKRFQVLVLEFLLLWIDKPSPNDFVDSGCSSGKFMCWRKKTFGLNCQAASFSDVRGQILDISIMYPGSTSDCLTFEGMSLFLKLKDGILAPGLCLLFGHNADLKPPSMATPYAAVSGGSKDAYSFHHSQLRIRIDCTF